MQLSTDLTDRQLRELSFYDEHSNKVGLPEVTFELVESPERRPWNSCWFLHDVLIREFRNGARTLLDVGCGASVGSVIYAHLGYEVSAFDISPGNIAQAVQLADRHGVSDRTRFSTQVAERLDYPSGSFDVVVGLDVLHHVEIGPAVAECMRVLKPGGVAVFREWVVAPYFDAVRNTRLVRRLFPNDPTSSKDQHITDDERKLTDDDLSVIRGLCDTLAVDRFFLLARLDRYLGRWAGAGPSRLGVRPSNAPEWPPQSSPSPEFFG